jgi:hypothetical protein
VFPPGSLIQNLWPSSAYIDDVSILGYISSTLLDTVILFVVHDVVSVSVFKCTFQSNSTNPNTKKFR